MAVRQLWRRKACSGAATKKGKGFSARPFLTTVVSQVAFKWVKNPMSSRVGASGFPKGGTLFISCWMFEIALSGACRIALDAR